jgi:hypothetical protein
VQKGITAPRVRQKCWIVQLVLIKTKLEVRRFTIASRALLVHFAWKGQKQQLTGVNSVPRVIIAQLAWW